MNWGVEMAYIDNGTKCLAPMFIGREEYKKLLGGHIVELHEGEVALVKINYKNKDDYLKRNKK